MDKYIPIPTVGEFLLEEFLIPYKLSAYKVAKDIGVPVSRIQDLIHGRRNMTVDTSIRLGRYFGLDDLFFMRLQNDLDCRNVMRKSEKEFEKIKPCQRGRIAVEQ